MAGRTEGVTSRCHELTARHCHQPQQAASGTEHTGQCGMLSTMFCQCHGVNADNYTGCQSTNE